MTIVTKLNSADSLKTDTTDGQRSHGRRKRADLPPQHNGRCNIPVFSTPPTQDGVSDDDCCTRAIFSVRRMRSPPVAIFRTPSVPTIVATSAPRTGPSTLRGHEPVSLAPPLGLLCRLSHRFFVEPSLPPSALRLNERPNDDHT